MIREVITLLEVLIFPLPVVAEFPENVLIPTCLFGYS